MQSDSRIPWHRRIQRWWHDFRWPVLGLLAIISFALGIIGYRKYLLAIDAPTSWLDIFYYSVRLFGFEYDVQHVEHAARGLVSWELKVARILSPTIMVYTALAALARIFYDQLVLVRLRFTRNHAVVVGLGRKGWNLVKTLRQSHRQVVTIEIDEDNANRARAREVGAVVLIGDGTDPNVLRKSGIRWSRYLVSVCGEDGTNAEVAIQAYHLVRTAETHVLTCFVHIVEPRFCALLRERGFGSEESESFRLEFFNIYESGAQILLAEQSPFRADELQPHMLVIGAGRMGECLVVTAARQWYQSRPPSDRRLRITIVDRKAVRKTEQLRQQYSKMDLAAKLVAVETEISPADSVIDGLVSQLEREVPVTSVYICLGNDSLALSIAFLLLDRLRERQVPVAVRMTESVGLTTLIGDESPGMCGYDCLKAFPLYNRTCTPGHVFEGLYETIGRASHEVYVAEAVARGETRESNPSLVPWSELSEEFRESNRQQGRFMRAKLQVAGYTIAPLTDWDAGSCEFKKEEIELMSQMEHERYVKEKLDAGWTYAPGPKDMAKRTNPTLVPWEDLPEVEKDKDRVSVRNIPVFLAKVGLQVEGRKRSQTRIR